MSKLIYHTIFFSALCAIFIVRATEVSQCQKNTANLPNISIVDCDKSPCTFYVNTKPHMTFSFRSPSYLENITPKALAIVMGLEVDYDLGQPDACDGITNTPCPLAEGELIEYTYGLCIVPLFQLAPSVTLEFSLVDVDTNEPFECFRVDLQIEKAKNESDHC